jgi:hypothetical protein
MYRPEGSALNSTASRHGVGLYASAAALRQKIRELADSPRLVRVADLSTRAAISAPTEGRALYAGLRALDVPQEPAARLWHAATLLREHRGDGHNAALVAHGTGGIETHVLIALSFGDEGDG